MPVLNRTYDLTEKTEVTRLPPYKLLDAFRAMAAIAVLMVHARHTMIAIFKSSGNNLIYRVAAHGHLGVQLFFVISGFCIANAADGVLFKQAPIRAYVFARIKRIYPTYWAALVLAMLFSASASLAMHFGIIHSTTLGGEAVFSQGAVWYIANFTLTAFFWGHFLLISQAWTLCYEVAFYAIIGAFIAITVKLGGTRSLCTLSHILTCICLLLLASYPKYLPFPFLLWPQFGYGVLLFDCIKHKASIGSVVGMIAISLFTLCILFSSRTPIMVEATSTAHQFVFAYLAALVLLGLYKHDNLLLRYRGVKMLCGVGIFSYSLYLTHTMVFGIVSQGMRILGLPKQFDMLIFLFMILAAIIFARIFYQFFERPMLSRYKVSEIEKVEANTERTEAG